MKLNCHCEPNAIAGFIKVQDKQQVGILSAKPIKTNEEIIIIVSFRNAVFRNWLTVVQL